MKAIKLHSSKIISGTLLALFTLAVVQISISAWDGIKGTPTYAGIVASPPTPSTVCATFPQVRQPTLAEAVINTIKKFSSTLFHSGWAKLTQALNFQKTTEPIEDQLIWNVDQPKTQLPTGQEYSL